MLRADELEAIIVGNEVPDDRDLRTVFPDVAASARRFWDAHGFVPVNHLVTIRREHAESQAGLVAELLECSGRLRTRRARPAAQTRT